MIADEKCRGCADRGNGTICPVCSLPIPDGYRRHPGEPDDPPGFVAVGDLDELFDRDNDRWRVNRVTGGWYRSVPGDMELTYGSLNARWGPLSLTGASHY